MTWRPTNVGLFCAVAFLVEEVASLQEVAAVVFDVPEEIQAHVALEVGYADADGGTLLRDIVLELPQSLAILRGPRCRNVFAAEDGLLGLRALPQDPKKVAVRIRAVA